MEAKIKALEVELSEEKQMRQDKEQEVGHYSVLFYTSHTRCFFNRERTRMHDL